jgi:hypothetical protein
VHSDSEVRQIEIHTAQPLVPDPSPFEVEIVVAKLKSMNRQAVFKFRQKQEVKKYPSLRVKSIYRLNYWVLSVWVL